MKKHSKKKIKCFLKIVQAEKNASLAFFGFLVVVSVETWLTVLKDVG